jgi:hypothetical protein
MVGAGLAETLFIGKCRCAEDEEIWSLSVLEVWIHYVAVACCGHDRAALDVRGLVAPHVITALAWIRIDFLCFHGAHDFDLLPGPELHHFSRTRWIHGRCESCFRLVSRSGDEVVRLQGRAQTLLEGNFTAD